jgi:hypothetical protein
MLSPSEFVFTFTRCNYKVMNANAMEIKIKRMLSPSKLKMRHKRNSLALLP